jgi:hypothetical protein
MSDSQQPQDNEASKVKVPSDSSFNAAEHLHTESNTNTMRMRCLRCDSLILEAKAAVYRREEVAVDIPSMRKKHELHASKSEENGVEVIHTESSEQFWLLSDMLTFENIGFTNTVDKKKYLICADCEIGPLGFQSLDKPNEFLVCVERVKYC